MFRLWNEQLQRMLRNVEPDDGRLRRCLAALQALRFELAVPYIDEESPDIVLENDNTTGSAAGLEPTPEHEAYTHVHTPFIYMAESLGVPVSSVVQKELLRIQRTDVPTLVRAVAVGSPVSLTLRLVNPLQVAIECRNVRAFGRLITESELRSPCPTDPTETSEDPFVFDPPQDTISFSAQDIKLEPLESVSVTCPIIPHQPGRLEIQGVSWDLYGIARGYYRLRLWDKKRPTKQVVAEALGPNALSAYTWTPGILPFTSPVAPLLADATTDYTPLSPLPHELPTVSPAFLLRQALLLSHLTSDAFVRMRRSLEYDPSCKLTLSVYPNMPRLRWTLGNWPTGPVLEGQRHEVELTLQNIGTSQIAAIHLATSPSDCLFIADNLTTSNPTHVYRMARSVAPGSTVTVKLVLRGTDVGTHLLGLCMMASSDVEEVMYNGNSQRSVAGSQTSGASSFPNLQNAALQRTPTRKWILARRPLTVVPSLEVAISHHASWREPGAYVVVAQIARAGPVEDHEELVVEKVDALLPYDSAPPVVGRPASLRQRAAPSTGSWDTGSLAFIPVALSPSQERVLPVPAAASPTQLVFATSPFLPPHEAEPPVPIAPVPDVSQLLHAEANRLMYMFAVVRARALERNEVRATQRRCLASLLKAAQTNNLQDICRKKGLLDLTSMQELPTRKLPCLGPAIDYVIHWVLRRHRDGKIAAVGETFVHRVPLFTAVSSCPLKFQLHPAVRVLPAPGVPHLAAVAHVKLTLHNISQTTPLSIVIETDGEASCRGLAIHHQGTTEGAYGETGKAHRQWMANIKNVINVAVRSKDTPAFFGASANRFPASGIFWLGRTSFFLGRLEPGHLLSTTMHLCCYNAGLFNLNKFRFIVRTEGTADERIFAFPFESLLYVQPPADPVPEAKPV